MIDSIGGMSALTGNTNIEAMRQQHRAQMFSRIDKNGDGSIDKTEMQTFADKMSAKTGQSMNVDDVFTKYDANGDGVLNQDEMDAAMTALRKSSGQTAAPNTQSTVSQALFSSASSSGNTDSTLLSMLNGQSSSQVSGMGQGGMPSPQEMFKQVDTNGDGSVDKAELQAFADKVSAKTGQSMNVDEVLTKYDTNKDGVLSEAEMDAAMASLAQSSGQTAAGNTQSTDSTLLSTLDGQSSSQVSGMSQGISAYGSVSDSQESTLLSTLTDNSASNTQPTLLSTLTNGSAQSQSYNPFDVLA